MIQRVYPQGYTLFVGRDDVASISINTLSSAEGEQVLSVALSQAVPSIVLNTILAAYRKESDSARANMVRSVLRDYFAAHPEVKQIVASVGPSQQNAETSSTPLPRQIKPLSPTITRRQIPSDSVYGVKYTLTYENGNVVSCTCPNYEHVQKPLGGRCKHMNRYPRN